MCESPTVKKVSFTGSTPVAKMLYKYAAGTLKKYVSVPPLVCLSPDSRAESRSKLEATHRSSYSMTPTSTPQSKVDFVCCFAGILHFTEAYAGAIACKFRHTGQTCVCANRIYVQSSVYADFASKLAEKVAAFRVGNGFDDQTYVLLSAVV